MCASVTLGHCSVMCGLGVAEVLPDGLLAVGLWLGMLRLLPSVISDERWFRAGSVRL